MYAYNAYIYIYVDIYIYIFVFLFLHPRVSLGCLQGLRRSSGGSLGSLGSLWGVPQDTSETPQGSMGRSWVIPGAPLGIDGWSWACIEKH